MFLIIGNNSLLLETSLTLLKLPFILINSFNCLVNTISELEKDIKQLFIVNSNTSIKKINENIDKLLSIKESCIIGYKNNFLIENSKIDSINDFSIDINNSFSAYNNKNKY